MTTRRRTSRLAARAPLAALALLCASTLSPLRAQVVERFAKDPLDGGGRHVFFAEGDAAARFTYLSDEPARFPGDRRGTLRVLYDTTLPAARLSTPLGRVLSLDADFEVGAILTIRSEGFFADPNGFSQIAFGAWNAATTGIGRTSFPSDSFDLLEFDYFPNVTSFGGPFLSPSVFGGNVGGNAFFNFAFRSSEVDLPHDTPLLVRCRYRALARRLEVTVHRHAGGLLFETIPGGSAVVDLSGISPAFLLNVLGIAGYFEGFPSIHASVDYDLLYAGPLPTPWGVIKPMAPQPGETSSPGRLQR
ncbi:MAG TPA: hypothetical protein VKF61_07760 [Candidatus Polarisedimenticolia bacterium]|nr:hypothetical protein [Candidatus Polarisedimenticolia bacterium]